MASSISTSPVVKTGLSDSSFFNFISKNEKDGMKNTVLVVLSMKNKFTHQP